MSSDRENEYFSDGITEEILNALSKIEGLHVTARTSSFAFKNKHIDIKEIGRKLNVSLILEGSIRKSGNTVRIAAQLTRSDNGYHVWSDNWDRELKDIFIVQDEIAAIIAEKIHAGIRLEVSTTDYIIENTDALDFYLKGKYLLNTWDFNQGKNIIENFEKAIALDPNFIKAYIGLCNVYVWLGSTGFANPTTAQKKVEYYIEKVTALNKDLPEVYEAAALRNFWIDWDIPLALKNISKALKLKPSYPTALLDKGLILAALNRIEEALDCLFQAERLDPLSDQVNACIGMIYNLTGEPLKALEYVEKNISICPYWYAQYLTKVEALCKLKRYDEALSVIRMLENDPNSPLSVAELKGYYYASRGDMDEAHRQLEIMENDLKKRAQASVPDAAFFCSIYLMLGEESKALDYLEFGLNHVSTPLLFIRIDNLWEPLRNHPRYLQAIEKIRFTRPDVKMEEERKKYKKSNLSRQQAIETEKTLSAYMEKTLPWLNQTLTLSDLAESIDVTPNLLSQVLNEHAGKNFYDYINSYRLNHFLKLSREKKYRNYTLLSLAYECGFNSKTTFNAFFKKITGKTPTDYFKKPD